MANVITFYLTVDYGYGDTRTFHNLSRIALERYKEWYRDDQDVFNMHYGPEKKQ